MGLANLGVGPYASPDDGILPRVTVTGGMVNFPTNSPDSNINVPVVILTLPQTPPSVQQPLLTLPPTVQQSLDTCFPNCPFIYTPPNGGSPPVQPAIQTRASTNSSGTSSGASSGASTSSSCPNP